MSNFVRKGSKIRYSFSDRECIGRTCWAPGMYQHRSPLSCGGSRNSPCGCRKEVDEAGNITCYRVPGCKGNFPEGAVVVEMEEKPNEK